jgi:hypothetical protein
MEEADVAAEVAAGAGVRGTTLLISLNIGCDTSLLPWAPGARASRESMA